MMGASQSALSIQNPSQSGPRTHADRDDFRTHGAAVPISSTAAGEESSVIRALPSAPLARSDPIIDAISPSLELHREAAASRVDSNAPLCRGKADYHTGLICHDGASSPSAKSHAPRPSATHGIMTVEILKMPQVENITNRGRAGHSDPAYRHSAYPKRIVFSPVSERSRPRAATGSKMATAYAHPQRCVWPAF